MKNGTHFSQMQWRIYQATRCTLPYARARKMHKQTDIKICGGQSNDVYEPTLQCDAKTLKCDCGNTLATTDTTIATTTIITTGSGSRQHYTKWPATPQNVC
ncbi:unnamed protein product [Ceratitis capitata]|uniref:(Mediterranean fruit fly) hypothetical protein n=1 Tax=Ceratitis capitata TaxID=7213 RepID=A0A811U5Y6_CERCA|nr:unnamed protein product [Ceratitis capitata]